MSFVEDSWIAHTKGKYPREFASPNRLHNPIENDDMLVKLVRAYTPAHNSFCSVYSFDKWERVLRNSKDVLVYENAIIDCLFIDLDCDDNLHYAHYEAKMLDLYYNHYKCEPREYFSGSKGFAFYIDFPEVRLDKTLVKLVLRTYLESIQSILSLRSIDRMCFDCISRISRPPNTLNHRSGLYCIPLTREQLWGPLSSIRELAKQPSKAPVIVNECTDIPSILLSIEADLKSQQKEKVLQMPPVKRNISNGVRHAEGTGQATSLCPGVMEIVINKVHKGTRDNSLCAVICALNLQTRKSKDEIFPIVKNWAQTCVPPIELSDFELLNKIDYLVNSNYRPCTFALRTNNPMCKKCPVTSR